MSDFPQAFLIIPLIVVCIIGMFHLGVQGLEASQRERVKGMIEESKEKEERHLRQWRSSEAYRRTN